MKSKISKRESSIILSQFKRKGIVNFVSLGSGYFCNECNRLIGEKIKTHLFFMHKETFHKISQEVIKEEELSYHARHESLDPIQN